MNTKIKNTLIRSLLMGLFFTTLSCSNTYDDSAIWAKLDEHEKRITKLEETIKSYNELQTATSDLETFNKSVKDLNDAISELKKEQKKISDKLDEVNTLTESEITDLNTDISNMKIQIQSINTYLENSKEELKTKVFKLDNYPVSSSCVISFINNENMILYATYGTNILQCGHTEMLYEYIVNGHSCLSFVEDTGNNDIVINNVIKTQTISSNTYYSYDIQDYFGTDISLYIANSYSEIIKKYGYKISFGYYDEKCVYKIFSKQPIGN